MLHASKKVFVEDDFLMSSHPTPQDTVTNVAAVETPGLELRKPTGVTDVLWNNLCLNNPELKKRISDFATHVQAPHGFSDLGLWASMPLEFKLEFLEAEKKSGYKRHISQWKSPVLRFFFDHESGDLDTEAAINSFALIDALILTIPYAIYPNYHGEYWSQLKQAFASCPVDSYVGRQWKDNNDDKNPGMEFIYRFRQFHSNCAAAVYGSTCGLLLAAVYYAFKEKHGHLTSRQRRKHRSLLMLIFLSSVCAIIGIMNLSGSLTFVSDDWVSLCNDRPFQRNTLAIGLTCICIATVAGVAMMW